MRDFTKPSINNGLVAEGGAIKHLVKIGATAPEIEEIKPRFIAEDKTPFYRFGDIEDYVNEAENEFQEFEY